MTRSDLINSLGVGSRLSSEFVTAARYLDTNSGENRNNKGDLLNIHEEEGDEESDDDDDDSESDSDESSVDEDDNNEEENESFITDSDSKNIKSGGWKKIVIPCKAQDIGGFYSSFCTLAKKIEIGTKVSF